MKHSFIALTALLAFTAYASPEDNQSVPACMMCREDLRRNLEACKSQPADAELDVCRAGAHEKAKRCGKEHAGQCNLDLIMEPAKGPETKKSKT